MWNISHHPNIFMLQRLRSVDWASRRNRRDGDDWFFQVVEASSRNGVTFQMSSQYSRMARSEEKRPHRATLRMDIRAQRRQSWQTSLTEAWQLT
jgi:hypothetical protein